jgi:hypothetical protein
MWWTQGHPACMNTVATVEATEDAMTSKQAMMCRRGKELDEKGSAGGLVSS